MLIGLCGLAGSGKDTCAKWLHLDFGYERYAFADALRESIYTLNPFVDGSRRLREVVEEYGYEIAKRNFPEIRRLLQVYGTEVGRELYGSSFWIDRLFSKIGYRDRIVISDVRMTNEVDAIKARGGIIVWVDRPGLERMSHASEQMDHASVCDHRISNDGTLEDFYSRTVDLMKGMYAP
jgi:hypothetical protein